MSFDNSCCKAVLTAWANPKQVLTTTFLAALGQAMRGWKAVDLGS